MAKVNSVSSKGNYSLKVRRGVKEMPFGWVGQDTGYSLRQRNENNTLRLLTLAGACHPEVVVECRLIQ